MSVRQARATGVVHHHHPTPPHRTSSSSSSSADGAAASAQPVRDRDAMRDVRARHAIDCACIIMVAAHCRGRLPRLHAYTARVYAHIHVHIHVHVHAADACFSSVPEPVALLPPQGIAKSQVLALDSDSARCNSCLPGPPPRKGREAVALATS